MNASLAAVRNDLETCTEIQTRHARPLPSPATLIESLPIAPGLGEQIRRHRAQVRAILNGDDDRLLVITGPCSLHDPQAALDYGRRLAALADQVGDRLLLVMRAYVEKPRTTVGWKGLLHDPHLDGSDDLAEGLRVSRRVLIDLAELGLPLATELLSPLAANYLEDTLSWAAVGARTTESQTHREMISGLGMPVGFKNGTDGELATARDAMQAAAHPHTHLGVDANGQAALIRTAGNPDTHLVLRGGRTGPNFDDEHMRSARWVLESAGLNPRLIVDCSHANSGKDPARQRGVLNDLIAQRRDGENAIAGVMLESHINAGNQSLQAELQYGVSVTDACMGWSDTRQALQDLANG